MARAKKSKYDYIIGQRFGYIEPLEYIGRGKFRCLCHNCGNTEYINTSQHILAGECKSCGCLPRYKDITGTIINGFKAVALIEIRKNKAIWKWECIDCGASKNSDSSHVKRYLCRCKKEQQKQQELIGKVFGNLVVESFAYVKNQRRYWNCRCSCGNIKSVSTHDLTKGYVKSCGCLRSLAGKDKYGFKDITGKTFGNLTALTHIQGKYWKFRCNLCNKEKIMRNIDVTSGKCYSCGCVNLGINGSRGENEVRAYIDSLLEGE